MEHQDVEIIDISGACVDEPTHVARPTQKISLFVDGANMYFAQKKLGWYIDFRRVVEHFCSGPQADVSEAYYYTGADGQGRNRDNAFHDYLIHAGYTVRTKAIRQLIDDLTGEPIWKANLDIELAIDMFNTVCLYDCCVLMSGDGDFERALELVRSKGKQIMVVAHPDMTARELRNVAGKNFLDIRDLKDQFARLDKHPDPASQSRRSTGRNDVDHYAVVPMSESSL